jgi:hypothetical protein
MISAENEYLIFLTHEPDPDNAGVGMNITFMVHFNRTGYGCDFRTRLWVRFSHSVMGAIFALGYGCDFLFLKTG